MQRRDTWNDFSPMEAKVGPPLPTVLDAKWPWYKEPTPTISFAVILDGIHEDAYDWQLEWFDEQGRNLFTSGFTPVSSPVTEVPAVPAPSGSARGHLAVEIREYSGASRGKHYSPVFQVKQGQSVPFDWMNSDLPLQ